MVNWALVERAFPSAAHTVVLDGYAGVTTKVQWAEMFENWKVQLPSNVPALSAPGAPYIGDNCPACYVNGVAFTTLRGARLAIVTSNADDVQRFFLSLSGLATTREVLERTATMEIDNVLHPLSANST
eukprot:gene24672-6021_t